MTYSNTFDTFVNQVIWWDRRPSGSVDVSYFLCFLLSKAGADAVAHAKSAFGFTNADFQEALRRAPAGIFSTDEDWTAANIEYGIDPPLPAPRKKWLT